MHTCIKKAGDTYIHTYIQLEVQYIVAGSPAEESKFFVQGDVLISVDE
jgi:hypothetical protein